MSTNAEYITVCDQCRRGTWYPAEGPCHYSRSTYCPTCDHRTGDEPCTGTLRVIDRSKLAPQFHHIYGTEARIRVRFAYGEERTGTVGKTTGWRPVYLLMARADSIGSADVLGPDDVITAIKQANGRRYTEVRS